MAKKLSLVKHMQIVLKLLVIFWSRANLIYRIYSIKRRPRINAASSCGVYSNNRLKKHMVIIASIAVGDFEWTRHKSFWMYQFWCRESISDLKFLFTLCIAVIQTCKLWNWEEYNKWLFREALKHVSVFFFLIKMISYPSIVYK